MMRKINAPQTKASTVTTKPDTPMPTMMKLTSASSSAVLF